MLINANSLTLSGASKREEAADLFVRAANQYKVAKRFKGQSEREHLQ
jgi:hypothetical protein